MVPSKKSLECLRGVAEKSRYAGIDGSADEILQCIRFAMQWADSVHPAFGYRQHRVEQALAEIDRLLDTHGVECINDTGGNYACRMDGSDILLEYINMGDPYVATIVYDTRTETFRVMCWGDWLETYERRHGRIGGE